MRKKLEGNGMWESSRMMLPEHKERINRHTKELDLKTKPVLDEQKLEDINNVLREALDSGKEITLTLFHPVQSHTVTGYVRKFDLFNQKILIGEKWISLSAVLDCK